MNNTLRYIVFIFSLFSVYGNAQKSLSDSLQNVLDSETNIHEVARLQNQLGVVYLKQGQYSDALGYLQSTFDYYKDGFSKERAIITDQLAVVYYYLRAYDYSMEYAYETLDYYQENPNYEQPAKVLNTLGLLHISLGEYDKALGQLNLALKLNTENENLSQQNKTLNNISTVYYKKKDYKKSFEIDRESLKIALELSDTLAIASRLNNVGANHVKRNDLDSALYYYKRAYFLSEFVQDIQGEAITIGNIGEIYAMQGLSKQALKYINQSIGLAKKCGDRKTVAHNYHRLATFFQQTNKYQLSNQYLYKFMILNDSINNKDSKQRISNLQVVHETKRKEKELKLFKATVKLLETETDLQKNKTRLFFTISSAFFIILIMLGFRLRQKVNSNKQQQLIYEQERKVKKLEIEKQDAINLKLKSEIDHKSRQLSSTTMKIYHKNEILNEIGEYIKKSPQNILKDENIKEVYKLIKHKNHLDSDWEEFKIHFEEVHPNFFEKLETLHPQLTKTDMRHCAYIRMQMTTKEIANLLNITPASVQISRVRLKKKINLSREKSLQNYIITILNS